tara:strand:- start:2228 stop:2758 length:531 start_codon:yes stop_codon:yes gene_type:complete
MKKLIISMLVLCFSATAFAQDNFDKFEDMKGVTSMVMTPKMFKLLGKVDLNSSDPEMQNYIDLVNNLDNIKMYTSTDENVSQQMRTDVKSYLGSANLEELMRVKDDGKNVKFYYKPGKNDDYVREFMMFLDGDLDGDKRTVIIKITGDIDLKQISKLAKDINFPGGEELKNVKKPN